MPASSRELQTEISYIILHCCVFLKEIYISQDSISNPQRFLSQEDREQVSNLRRFTVTGKCFFFQISYLPVVYISWAPEQKEWLLRSRRRDASDDFSGLRSNFHRQPLLRSVRSVSRSVSLAQTSH